MGYTPSPLGSLWTERRAIIPYKCRQIFMCRKVADKQYCSACPDKFFCWTCSACVDDCRNCEHYGAMITDIDFEPINHILDLLSPKWGRIGIFIAIMGFAISISSLWW